MNPDHAHFAEWDSAYVLGALSPADRREYEEHLETCEQCRRSRRRARPDARAARPARRPTGPRPCARIPTGHRVPGSSRRPARRGAAGGPASPAPAQPVLVAAAATVAAFAVVAVVAIAAAADASASPPPRASRSRSSPSSTLPLIGHGDAHPGRVGHEHRARLPLRARPTSDGPSGESWPYALVVVDADGDAQRGVELAREPRVRRRGSPVGRRGRRPRRDRLARDPIARQRRRCSCAASAGRRLTR